MFVDLFNPDRLVLGVAIEPMICLTIRWSGPGMLRDLETKLYDVSGRK